MSERASPALLFSGRATRRGSGSLRTAGASLGCGASSPIFFAAVKVQGRHLALPLERYADLGGLEDRNAAWLGAALELGEGRARVPRASGFAGDRGSALRVQHRDGHCCAIARGAPDESPRFRDGLPEVAAVWAGLRCWSCRRRADLRVPRGSSNACCAPLVCRALSLTFRTDDFSVSNLIATGLFGDGAVCVLVVGDEHPLASSGIRVTGFAFGVVSKYRASHGLGRGR